MWGFFISKFLSKTTLALTLGVIVWTKLILYHAFTHMDAWMMKIIHLLLLQSRISSNFPVYSYHVKLWHPTVVQFSALESYFHTTEGCLHIVNFDNCAFVFFLRRFLVISTKMHNKNLIWPQVLDWCWKWLKMMWIEKLFHWFQRK